MKFTDKTYMKIFYEGFMLKKVKTSAEKQIGKTKIFDLFCGDK